METVGLAPTTRCLQGSVAPMEHAPPKSELRMQMAGTEGLAPTARSFGNSVAALEHGRLHRIKIA